MKRILLLISYFFVYYFSPAQNNILLLQKKNKTMETFFPGKFISIETRDKNYADGIITRITSDSVYIGHFDIEKSFTNYGAIYFDTAFRYTTIIHYKDIGSVLFPQKHSARKRNGTILMIAGAGVMMLGALNGLYRGDPPKDWYKPSGYITAGALVATGLLMRKSSKKKYTIGKKYQLKVLSLNSR